MCFKNSKVYSAKVVPLKDLLLKGNKYEIPKYQRPYAWEEKHWEDLWNDLRRAYSKKGEYLLGSVYLNENNEILDGQQRFTTLYILLKCLGFNKDEICNIELGGNDKEFFEKIKCDKNISDDEIKTASQRKLKNCYEFFKEKMKDLNLDNFKKFIQNQIFFINTTINDKDKTNSIITFITQTDRGKRLSNLEKIKSNLYYAAYTLFDNKEKLEKIQDNIQNIFGECYKHINILYDKPEKGERMIVEALFGLLLKDRKDKSKQDEIWKLDWMSGEDKITEEINKILSSNKQEQQNFLLEILEKLEKIQTFLEKYSQTVKGNELFHNELDLNRYTLVAMIEGDFNTKENEPKLEKKPKNEEDEKWFKGQNLILGQYKSLKGKELNKKEFILTLPITQQPNKIEIINQKLIERAEFSIFKAGNSPYSEFLSNPISKIQSYKYEYLYLIKKGVRVRNYRYFLFAYEKFYNPNFDYKEDILNKKDNKGEYVKIEREHLFAQNPSVDYWDKIKQGFENNKTGYEEWKNQIGNILLLPKTTNIEISNAMPWEKAEHILDTEKYKLDDIIFQSTFDFLKDIHNECNKKQNDIEKIQEVKKLCEKRTEMLKCFVWHRF